MQENCHWVCATCGRDWHTLVPSCLPALVLIAQAPRKNLNMHWCCLKMASCADAFGPVTRSSPNVRKECVTSPKNICVGGYINNGLSLWLSPLYHVFRFPQPLVLPLQQGALRPNRDPNFSGDIDGRFYFDRR